MKRFWYRLFYRLRKLFNPTAIYVWQKGDNKAAEKLHRKYFPEDFERRQNE
jgi:hypothetical protein